MAARAELERDELRAALTRLYNSVRSRMTGENIRTADRLEYYNAWKTAGELIPQNSVIE